MIANILFYDDYLYKYLCSIGENNMKTLFIALLAFAGIAFAAAPEAPSVTCGPGTQCMGQGMGPGMRQGRNRSYDCGMRRNINASPGVCRQTGVANPNCPRLQQPTQK